MLRRIGLLFLGDGASRVIGIGIGAILARVLGVAGFGILASAMSLALVVSVAIDFGQNILVSRMVARDRQRGCEQVTHVIANKVVFTLVSALVVGLGSRLIGAETAEVQTSVLFVVWGGGLSTFDSLRAVARATNNYTLDSAANGLESVLRLCGVLAVWAAGGGLVVYAALFAAEAIVASAVLWVLLNRRVSMPVAHFQPVMGARLLKEALPIGVASLGLAGFYRLDQVFVRGLAGPNASGLYGAAARISLAANIVGSLVMMAAFPDMARARDSIPVFRTQIRRALKLSLTFGALVTALLILLARPLILTLYGQQYEGAVALLRILALVVVLNALTTAMQHAANALGREARTVPVVLTLALGVIAANAILIPHFGVAAAAWISVAAEALMALGLASISLDRVRRTS